ncbi:MAG TPA: hypothetical protein VHU80_05495, partial [Polyangiaceae bacterium]|nr:hypothetical protein [Polyangiaceae bacterium]
RNSSMEQYRKRNYGPHRVAAAIVDAVRKRKGFLPVTPESWALYYLKRLAPNLVGQVLARDELQPEA